MADFDLPDAQPLNDLEQIVRFCRDVGVPRVIYSVAKITLPRDGPLSSVMQKMKAEGNKVPQFCFWAFNGPSITVVQDLYEKIYKAGKYKDLWYYWDKAKIKPINISISETGDPRGAWNIYPVPAPQGVDGGGIGFSRKWIGYSFPGGPERTFVMRAAEAKAGDPATVYHFAGSLGHPVFTQDATDDLLFVALTEGEIVLTTLGDGKGGAPAIKSDGGNRPRRQMTVHGRHAVVLDLPAATPRSSRYHLNQFKW